MERKSKERHKGKVIGIDGFLLFFIGTLFATPIVGVLGYLMTLGSLISYATLIDIVFFAGDLAVFAASFYIAINLWKLNYKAVKWAKIYLFVKFLWDMSFILFALSQPEFYGIFSIVILTIQTIIYTVVWLPYLFLSKRVKNTYTTHPVKTHTPMSSIIIVSFFIILSNALGLLITLALP